MTTVAGSGPGLGHEVVGVADVETIANDVWDSALAGGLPPDGGGAGQGLLVGAVSIGGAWRGWVTLELPAAAAARLTAGMLGLADGDAEPADAEDALGELANMVGGSIKSLLPGPSTLGLPMVVGDPCEVVGDGLEICRVELSRDGVDLSVRVWQAPITGPAPEPMTGERAPNLEGLEGREGS